MGGLVLSGLRWGAYQVHERIGVGGMGEVYRARDTKLGRDVALKILPPSFSTDPERLARFDREARLLAAINHPHIAAIYGLDEADGVRGLILELVKGPTLAELLRAAPLPLAVGLQTASQIAEALEAAHERNILHRDLKPANIKIAPDGGVKVLDFGLAKDVGEDAAVATMPEAPTVAMATREGVLLGTPAYMSPEQARGKAVDRRTDIWAFGCVLYEMLAGRPAFAGETLSDTIAAILEREPVWQALPDTTPLAIRRLLERCLNKDPKQRLRDIGDARIEIAQELAAPASRAIATPIRKASRREQLAWAMGAIATLLLSAFAVWSLIRNSASAARVPVRFAIQLDPGEELPSDSGLPRPLMISPDGQTVVYVTRRSAGNRIYRRRLDEAEPTPIVGTEGGIGPFISPDGGWIGFAAGGFIKKVPMAGGTPQNITPASNFLGGSWGPDDSIVYAEWNSGLFKVSADGGAREILTRLHETDLGHIVPHVLPGGAAALFSVRRRGTPTVEIVDVASGQRRALLEGSNPHFTSSGHLVFTRGRALHAVLFDLLRLETVGASEALPEQTRVDPQDRADFTVSADGTLVYVPAATSTSKLVWLDRGGKSRSVVEETRPFAHPRISPDGKRVVVQVAESGTSEVWIYDVERQTRLRLSSWGTRPIWTHDGRRITVQRDGLYSLSADDSKEPELVLARDPPGSLFPLSWSFDGGTLVYSRAAPDTNRDVFTLSAGAAPKPFLNTTRDERSAMLSPDGRWMVYAALEPGREEEVYVQPYPGPGERVLISQGGGREPVWSPEGSEIFYRSIDGRRMLAVGVQTEPNFRVGRPQMLFQGHFREGAFWANYDVTRDGHQFLMLESASPPQPGLNVVVHWAETLKPQ